MNRGMEMYDFKYALFIKNIYSKNFLFLTISLFLWYMCVQMCFLKQARLVLADSSISFISLLGHKFHPRLVVFHIGA